MSDDGELAQELREAFSNPNRIARERFALLKKLSNFVGLNPEEPEAQELVLRALEQRDQFADCLPILNALVRQVGLFPYLDPENLSIQDLIAYEFHRPANMDEEIVFHRPQARIYRMLMDRQLNISSSDVFL